jgi:hypothetical protein
VPFRGNFEGGLTRTPLDPPFVLDELESAGQASHLGQFELLITAVVNTTTRTAIGTYEFIAAHGYTLTAEFTGSSAPTATPGIILITEVATITGGTGRFADASGSFIAERLFDTTTGATVGTIEGTVSSPGQSRH